ncbi:MAG: hypothetical protein HY587_08485 [Candidatus Omnitrophica bacterium]|nr:hypothetical protein [Candidatus Omnitrophota bacterium]
MRNFDHFPTIEAFQKLPRQVIVKGGKTSVSENGASELSGIVINNLTQPIRNVRVNLILFDENQMPLRNITAAPHPNRLAQGTIGSFTVKAESSEKEIDNYYLYATWEYEDK